MLNGENSITSSLIVSISVSAFVFVSNELIHNSAPTGPSELLNSVTGQIDFSKPGSGAFVVTTPQELSIIRASKDVDYLKKVNVPCLGIIENMVAGVCSLPHSLMITIISSY